MKRFALFLLVFLSCFAWQDADAQLKKNNNPVRIMSYNVRNGKGLDNITDYNRIADVILKNQPDVVALQELDSVTNRSGGKYVLNEIACLTNMYAAYAPAITYDGGKYGIGMLSKQPPLSVKRYALPGREEARALLLLEFEDCIYGCTHLSLTEEDRMLSLEVMQNIAREANKPLVLAGDLNARPDSEFIKSLKANFTILSAIDQFTFPADKPNQTIDYIFSANTSDHVVRSIAGSVVEEPMASDHRPLWIDLIIQ